MMHCDHDWGYRGILLTQAGRLRVWRCKKCPARRERKA